MYLVDLIFISYFKNNWRVAKSPDFGGRLLIFLHSPDFTQNFPAFTDFSFIPPDFAFSRFERGKSSFASKKSPHLRN